VRFFFCFSFAFRFSNFKVSSFRLVFRSQGERLIVGALYPPPPSLRSSSRLSQGTVGCAGEW
jgi:hypothetical protein